jgi:putative DNA methylase
MTAAVRVETPPGLAPFSLKDAPLFIERQFPVGRLSAEAYKERKAGAGQTLTALGSYWKGRKPLILVRAVILGVLLPATDDPAKDLDIFLKLMAMDDAGLERRIKSLKASDIDLLWPGVGQYVSVGSGKPKWLAKLDGEVLARLVEEWFPTIQYERRLRFCKRPEECDEGDLLAEIWPEVNRHLGTNADSIPELIQQLGVARFGHRPKVADTFCGGGSIPFEAARIGCDVYASDLNPIACMLTWGAFNIIGASKERRAEIEQAQREVAAAVDAEVTHLEIEHDKYGNRAKAYLYCLETCCPKTRWMVPIVPSWVIATNRRVVGKLVSDHAAKAYRIEVHTGVSTEEMNQATEGTLRDGRLVHPMNPERSGVEIRTIRGDYRDGEGVHRNRLRLWEKSDFVPRPDDIFQERLYAIQWITKETLGKDRQETFFAAATEDDLTRERQVEAFVRKNLARWQVEGWAPDMPIEPGDKTDEPIRTRGWTHWHHLFAPRQLLFNGIAMSHSMNNAALCAIFPKLLNRQSKLCMYDARNEAAKREPTIQNTFSNQALNTMYVYGVRASIYAIPHLAHESLSFPISVSTEIDSIDAREVRTFCDLFITDPPYADAINYHEITEFFIAWLRKNSPSPLDQWTWDSRRNLAIKGKDEIFRRHMVAAYAAATRHMPDNGVQVVMFTHQDAGVWADLGGVLWAAGLRVTAAWNVVTETESALKEGNYVQGTVCLVLRKRLSESNARRMEIEAEIEETVATQLSRLTALDDAWHERTHAETLYTDGDLTLAAYAAALQVVTAYSTIDRQPLDRDLYRKLAKGESTMLRDLIGYAEHVANNLLVPEGLPKDMWRDLETPERFYVRMLDMEAKGATKVADFQNFAKSFAFAGYADLMASTAANAAALAGAADLKGRMLDGEGFAKTPLRQVLFAIWKTLEKENPKLGLTTLKTEYTADYWQRRQKLIVHAEYVAAKTKRTRPDESVAAHELAEALKLDRV